MTVPILEKCLIEGSVAIDYNFKRFILAVLTISREQLQMDRVFLLQKFFQIIENNIGKYIKYFDAIFEELRKFCVELRP